MLPLLDKYLLINSRNYELEYVDFTSDNRLKLSIDIKLK